MYIILSTTAYYIAVLSTFLFSDRSYLALNFAGIIGGLILALGLRLKYKVSVKNMFLIVLIGGVFVWHDDRNLLFPIWQSGMATIIGYSLIKNIEEL